MEVMEFSAYLITKKIDEAAWKKAEPDQFGKLKAFFDQVHPDSFTAQKLFLINPIRRRFPLKETATSTTAKPKMARPLIKPKPKTN